MKIFYLIIFSLIFSLNQDIAFAQKDKSRKTFSPEAEVHSGIQDRALWSDILFKIASPVVFNLAEGTLRQNMPVEKSPGYAIKAHEVSYLEAVGRTMSGLAPWLALPDDDTPESELRKKLRLAILKGIKNGVDPAHPDYLNFRKEQQPIVDAAFMAHAFLRAPAALWDPLDSVTKLRVITEFKSLRNRTVPYNNWLLFAAINETFLLSIGEQADRLRIDFGIKKMQEWYVGDGWYSDGPSFSMDYYNSFVIQPMLVDICRVLSKKGMMAESDLKLYQNRMLRHAEFQERMIGVDGSFPPFGRSITYRTGAFQVLAQTSLMGMYPDKISPGQVRSAMTAMTKKVFMSCNNFDNNGWLLLGFCGHQPEIADTYTSTGSLYMATLSFLPLGLPATDIFWRAPLEDWTQKKAWSSQSFKKDYKVNY
ncbi:MAG: DUF2264 domain-containing protein [Chitinophagaceae bacterium]